jgi:hypothetical protein
VTATRPLMRPTAQVPVGVLGPHANERGMETWRRVGRCSGSSSAGTHYFREHGTQEKLAVGRFVQANVSVLATPTADPFGVPRAAGYAAKVSVLHLSGRAALPLLLQSNSSKSGA